MAPRKRKAPEKKARSLTAALFSSTAIPFGIGLGHAGRGLGRLALRYPRPALGGLFFAAVFGTIAANALWYQPHRIPSPFLATRDLSHFDVLPGLRRKTAAPDDVTTFKIERAGDVVVEGETPAPAEDDADAGLQTAALPVRTAPSAAPIHQPENVALAVAVQQALIRRGLYDGVADGVIGPRTSAAILFYEQTAGLTPTGEVSETLLQSLAADGAAAAPEAPEAPEEADPVAAAIRQSGAAPAPKPAAEKAPVIRASGKSDDLAAIIRSSTGDDQPAAKPKTDPVVVRQIQTGLARMAYPDVEPDGVVGPGTAKAIRQFEKYYGMPVTGEPSAELLKRMKDMGLV